MCPMYPHQRVEVANAFKSFYASLYYLYSGTSSSLMYKFQTRIDEYQSSSCLPRLDPSAWNDLEAPISEKGIQAAVSDLKIGKSPGPGGFTAQNYKLLLWPLLPYLLKTLNALGGSSSFPHGEGQITVKEPPSCCNYYPISFLNIT